jgi:hypothetical protein
MAQEESIAMSSNERTEQDTIRVRRGRMDSIVVYDVTDQELKELERGGDGGIYLNVALSLASVAISFVIALTTTTITSDRQFSIFFLVAIVSAIGALILALLWWNCRKSMRALILSIKGRMPLDQVADKDAANEDSVDKVPT